jgi:WD40 repeat protein
MIITKANFTKSNIRTRTYVTPLNPSVAVIIGHQSSPYNSAYRWSTAGFGTRYTTVNAGEEVDGIAFNKAGDVVAYAIYRGSVTLNPAIGAWRWSGSTGFGTKYTNPSTLPPGTGYGIDFTANEDALAISHANSSFISVYRWSYVTGFGTRYSNPASALTGTGNACDFHRDDNALAVATATPYVYQWNSSTGFGTRYSNPSGIPTTAYDCEFSPDGTVLAYASISTPWIHAYRWSSAGYGTKYSNPTTLPGDRTEKIAWNPTGTAVAVAGWMGVVVYRWSNTTGFGTRYSAAVAGDGRGVSFSNDNTAIAAASQDSPRIQAWPWNDNTGFGTKYSNPGTLPTGSAYSIQYSVR